MPTYTKIQVRRGIAAAWRSGNPTLAAGVVPGQRGDGPGVGHRTLAGQFDLLSVRGAVGDHTIAPLSRRLTTPPDGARLAGGDR